MSERHWLSIRAYGRKYAVHRNTVRKWLDAGLLMSYRLDGVLRVQDALPVGAIESPPRRVPASPAAAVQSRLSH